MWTDTNWKSCCREAEPKDETEILKFIDEWIVSQSVDFFNPWND